MDTQFKKSETEERFDRVESTLMKIMEKLEGLDKPQDEIKEVDFLNLNSNNEVALRTLQTISDINHTFQDEIFKTGASRDKHSIESKNYTTINELSR